MRVLERTVLHCTEGSHNKFYEVNLCSSKAGSGLGDDVSIFHDAKDYAVICRWGRIEAFDSDNTAEQKKVSRVTKMQALGTYNSMVGKKLGKGYKVYKTFSFYGQFKEIDDTNQTAAERAKKITSIKLHDRTETLEIPMGSGWGVGSRISNVDREL